MVAVFAPLSIIILFLLRFLINAFKENRAMQRLEQQKADRLIVADDEVLERHKWKGADSHIEAVNQDDLSQIIRDSLKS
jgi:hypothetical protein